MGDAMTAAVWFWILMILPLLFGGWRFYNDAPNRPFYGLGMLLWVLLFLIGWKVFGPPIQ